MKLDQAHVDRAVAQAKAWTQAAKQYPVAHSAKLLAKVLDHPGGLDYTVSFVDGVIRPEDPVIASKNLRQLAGRDVSFLPAYLKTPAKAGGSIAPALPGVAAAAAERVFAALVGDLVLPVTPDKLGPAIAKLREDGSRLNLNLLGEAVLGDDEAARRMNATRELIERPDVDYVSLKVSSVIGPHAPFGYAAAVDNAVDKLLPVYRLAASKDTFVNLDMEEYRDLDLTIDVFKRILDRDEFLGYRAGIVLQAYLPDTMERLDDLTRWAQARRARGGAPIKVRVVKGANLSMERVDAAIHGWELTVQPTKAETDANYLAVLDAALTPERVDAVHIGIAGMNLLTLAYGLEVAKDRGITEGVDVEMLAGMATPQSRAVRDTVGPLLYYVPVVRPEEYDVAVAYLVRRLEENATPENFMSNVFEIDDDAVFAIEEERFRQAVDLVPELIFAPRRKQNRQVRGAKVPESFANVADTDHSLHANIDWAEKIASRIPTSTLGQAEVEAAMIASDQEASAVVASVRAASATWASRSARERAAVLRAVAQSLEDHRGELIEVAGAEAGKTIDQADIEVSEAIDFALYYADLAENLEKLRGATYSPVQATLVTPPWNFPIAIPSGGVLASLATGSGVVFKPAKLTRRTGAYVAKLMWEAGVPRDALALVCMDDSSLGRRLVEECDQVILTGSTETAQMFRSWRPDLRVFAETSGKNAVVVTPHADIDLAVKDIVYSAFGHTGQKCSAASLVILVGSVGFSKRFQRQLVDAIRSLKVGYPQDLATQMGPMVQAPAGKLLRGLTELGEGESWVIKPRRLGEKLWTPGLRAGVKPGSEYHLTEYFGPILGVMRADTLQQAIEWQNAVEFGLTAGLHSLDSKEIATWLDSVHAGNVYVNRAITGAIVRRQPFGGWKRSAVGAGTKAGGPNYLIGLGHVADAPKEPTGAELANTTLRAAQSVALEMKSVIDNNRFLSVVEGMDSALAGHFQPADPSDLGVEINLLRYVPAPEVVIRLGEGRVGDLLAVAAGALAAGAKPRVSSAVSFSKPMRDFLASHGASAVVETDEEFRAYCASRADTADGLRVRLIGGDARALAEAVGGSIDVAIYSEPVTGCGEVELLAFLQEQAVSATNHRFGNPTSLLDGVL
ncbi:MAG: bifunctional proline dehydrogenase/L-glutamate gamma-semialdehyde dehydrogenase [Actinomycetaceae bacterium]|nr:bifunctional proline dehydrogenase/L-glutamate gamma-semialdehyde dehydrogenase [Actinomycetaceae bacterium]